MCVRGVGVCGWGASVWVTTLVCVMALGGCASGVGQRLNVSGAERVAISGYDPVAYFEGGPERGCAEVSAEHGGATYRFATAEHRDRFAADPERYIPAYGGWCASAMASHGGLVDVDAMSYRVRDGRLFLFYKWWFIDARESWDRDPETSQRRADANWVARAEP